MTAPDATIAETIRKQGNELYKLGKLTEAGREYEKAAALAPNDPTPLSNLSSVKFELGEYSSAVEYILKSLQLTQDNSDAVARKKRTLHERLAKCYIHGRRFEQARKISEEIGDGASADGILGGLEALSAWTAAASEEDAPAHRMLMLDRLPRLMTNLENMTEYYAIGHDMAETLFDDPLQKSCSSQDSVALMFCGSGDARHVLNTLVMMGIREMSRKKRLCKDLHITLVDINAAAIARTLILLDMIVVYSVLRVNNTPGIEDAPTVMAYLYAAQVVPEIVNQKLQTHIEALLHSLENEDEPLHDWLYLPPATRKAVAQVLRRWQNPPQECCYSPRLIRSTVVAKIKSERIKTSLMYGHDRRMKAQPGFELDRKSFDDLGVVLPSKGFAERRDEPLVAMMEEYRKGSKAAKQKLAAHIDENWVTNLTLIDFDYSEARNNANDPLYPMVDDEAKVPSIESDPTELATMLPEISRGQGVLENLGDFFATTALILVRFGGENRLMIEAMVGEMTDIMERLRWDCLESRSLSPDAKIDPAKFPRKYDRIHMSNIPSDYIGGLFPVALYARPLLRENGESNLRFTVLLNPPEFRSHQDFQSEYLVLHDDNRIKDHFAMARIPGYTKDEVDGPKDKSAMLQAMRMNSGYSHLDSIDFITEGYIVWGRCSTKRLSRGKDLLSRPALEKWLQGFFLKICVPFTRPTVTMSPVYSPLNLTAFLRLIAHLADIGYPAHWLSGILADLCSGAIKTTARAPRAVITTPEHVNAVSPQLAMSTAPWAAELSTLLSIWSPLLPFGLTTPRGHLLAPTDIAEYSVSFPYFKDNSQLRLPHFILVFWKSPEEGGAAAPPPGNLLHSILREDEMSDELAEPKLTGLSENEMKRDMIRVFTTLSYDCKTKTVAFWSRVDAMQKLQEKEQWEAFIWRVDRWTRVTEGVKVSEGSVTMRRRWGG
ncbi:Tetratricopeptide [Madurella fahalii]|uniref:Tetratricopeptide n=1 Tax=Madurella fahalii TaxID=1157608 RepID=A0ABQ0GH22_9PEZI